MKKLIRKIVERIYLTYARAKCPNAMLDFSDCLAQALTALVVVPQPPRAHAAAFQLLADLRQAFPDTHFSVLLEKEPAARFAAAENLQVMPFSEEDIAFYGLPRKKLQNLVRDRHFDVVFDLNENFDLVAACLCLVSDARLRIALQHPKRDFLYNFQVRVAEHFDLELKYESLFKYLTCFKNISHMPEPDWMTA